MCDIEHNKLDVLISRLQIEACNLSYEGTCAKSKHLMHEARDVIEGYHVKTTKLKGKLSIKDCKGRIRKLTFKERIALFLLNGKTSITV